MEIHNSTRQMPQLAAQIVQIPDMKYRLKSTKTRALTASFRVLKMDDVRPDIGKGRRHVLRHIMLGLHRNTIAPSITFSLSEFIPCSFPVHILFHYILKDKIYIPSVSMVCFCNR